MYLCTCKGITDIQIRQLVHDGARTVGAISAYFGVGNECGKCLNDIGDFLNACLSESRTVVPLQETLPLDTGSPIHIPVETSPQRGVEDTPQKAAWFAIDL